MDDRWDQVAATLRRQPERTGLFLDYDGVLAPIVENPEEAEPVTGVTELLAALGKAFRRVALISGRPVSFLERHAPKGTTLVGLYGIEKRVRGRRRDHPGAGSWREAVADVAGSGAPPGMRIESKGLSLTAHYREHPEIEPDVRAWAELQAARSGLQYRPAKMSVELHPPIAADKGVAVADLAKGLATVLYAGDDVGDLPAFSALDTLRDAGVETVKVAVGGAEAPPELVERADVRFADPAELVERLRSLV